MCWTTTKSMTTTGQSPKVKTVVKAGAKKIDKLLIRRIPVNLLLFRPGHFWIELIHDDEDDTDPAMAQARQDGLTEGEINNAKIQPNKANGFRESYGWYPAGLPFQPLNIFNNNLVISTDGVLNGDHEKRKKKDKNKKLTPSDDREAGRKTNNNEHSIRPFDPHQNARFHPEKIPFTNNPYVLSDDKRTIEQIFDEIRETAMTFSDEWSWANDSYKETNCHTLLFIILASCNLADPECIGENLDKHFLRYKKSLMANNNNPENKIKTRQKLVKKLSNISRKAKLN